MYLSKTPDKIFFLGPKGTFTDKAREIFTECFNLSSAKVQEVCSISKAFDLLVKNPSSALILPIENSIEGNVRETIDNLIFCDNPDIKIISEKVVSIEQNLIGFASDLSQIKEISSHPQAIAQCRKFLLKNCPNAKIRFSDSTASAISVLSEDKKEIAAIGSRHCAELFHIPLIRENINDEKNNQTRFVLIGTQTLNKQNNSKTAITFTTANTPGALNKILSIFDKYGINMTQIESRPSKKSLGAYTFFIEIDGHFQEDIILKALFEVIQHTIVFKHLGSYISI